MSDAHGSSNSNRTYLNGVLTVIAAMLVVLAFRGEAGPTDAAYAAPPKLPPNAAEQRLQMIQGIERVESRLTAVEKKLSSAVFDVRVVEMPEISFPEKGD